MRSKTSAGRMPQQIQSCTLWPGSWPRSRSTLLRSGQLTPLQALPDATWQQLLHQETQGKRGLGSSSTEKIAPCCLTVRMFCLLISPEVQGSVGLVRVASIPTFSRDSGLVVVVAVQGCFLAAAETLVRTRFLMLSSASPLSQRNKLGFCAGQAPVCVQNPDILSSSHLYGAEFVVSASVGNVLLSLTLRVDGWCFHESCHCRHHCCHHRRHHC